MNPDLELEALAHDEDGRIEEVHKANPARQIIDSPLWQETFKTMEESLIRRAMEAETGEATMGYKNGLSLLRQVRTEFEEILTTGRLASEQLEKIKKRRGILNKIKTFGRAA